MSELKFYEYSETKTPKYLVIFLHGYGANGENLLNLYHEFKNILPEAHFISPNAPEAWEGGFPDAYQWFSLSDGLSAMNPTQMAKNIQNANNILENFINENLKRLNLTADKLILVGFSQGAMMSIYQGLSKINKPAGIVAFSGRLILPEMMEEKTINKPEICLIHGQDDSVVPFSHFIEAQEIMTQENIPFEAHEIANLDHSIDISAVRAAQNFLQKITQNP